MSGVTERLHRLLDSELDDCCDADVERRMDELDSLGEGIDDSVRQDSELLGTLGNETRLTLVRYLDAADRAMCVCELEAMAEVSESAVSHALSDLTEVGLVRREKRGKWRYYDSTERASEILAVLDDTRTDDTAGESIGGGR